MKHRIKLIAVILAVVSIFSVLVVPASAYSYPMSLTIYYKDEAGNTLKSPYTGSFNAAENTNLKWYAPTISGYALKNDSDATITYDMLDKSFPPSNYVRNGSATYTVIYVKTYTHIVNYLRGDNGVPIGSASRKTAKPGTTYSFTSPSVTGMTPSKSVVTGTITTSDTSETVYYYPITYTISYNANGGSGAPSSQTKNYGTDITITTSKPTRTGYNFEGWGLRSTSLSPAYSPGDTYSANMSTTLYAIWSAKTYTISYDANGGSGAPSSQIKTYGVDLTLSSTKPTRSGYTFKGWGVSSSTTYVSYQPGGTYSQNMNRTLYAIWEENAPTTYTVSYNANGGSGAPSAQTKTHGVTLTLSSTRPTRSGYTFKGWSTSSSATTVSYEDKAPASYNPSISAPAVKVGKATWNMWEYEGGEFVLKTYGIQVPNISPTLKASDYCKTAVYNGGKLTMRSGYGISLYFNLYLSNPGGAVFAPTDSFTFPQSVYATFPEYGYSTEIDRYRTLDYAGSLCSFVSNPDAEGNEKIHFIPVFVKNGEYIVSVTATQIWTPAGMITAVRNSNTITLNGSIYDDFYHGN